MVGWLETILLYTCTYVQNFVILIYILLLYRRKSRSISPRRRKSRSPSPRHRKSRSPTPRRYKKQKNSATSLSPIPKSSSPSLGSVDHKNACEKVRKDEEEKKRYSITSLPCSKLYFIFPRAVSISR